jgi:hypothetical protein
MKKYKISEDKYGYIHIYIKHGLFWLKFKQTFFYITTDALHFIENLAKTQKQKFIYIKIDKSLLID